MEPGAPAVRRYVEHFWSHWSAGGWELEAAELDRLVEAYARPGAFAASIAWYRAGASTVAQSLAETTPAPAERIATPTLVLWGSEEPLFPLAWSDRIDAFFADAKLEALHGARHFAPLEAPDGIARGVCAVLARTA